MSARAVLLASAGALITSSPAAVAKRCEKTFTERMFTRAAQATYHGTRLPRHGAYARLWHYARCQRPPSSEHRARLIWGRELRAWAARRQATSSALMSVATASWYEDGGSTASGFHARYGVANLTLAFGTRVRFCYPAGSARCLIATVDDRGPYVAGREWDLDQNVAAALGFSGVAAVGYRVLG